MPAQVVLRNIQIMLENKITKTSPASSSGVEEGVDDVEEEDEKAHQCQQGVRVQSIPGRKIWMVGSQQSFMVTANLPMLYPPCATLHPCILAPGTDCRANNWMRSFPSLDGRRRAGHMWTREEVAPSSPVVG